MYVGIFVQIFFKVNFAKIKENLNKILKFLQGGGGSV